MCGISGFNWKNEEEIRKMSTAIAHRGPDATGFFCEEGISFGHNRLSIIDLSVEANQPMFDQEKNLVIIYNGEIYNFKELKEELAPYPFKTKSDTEVILAGYKRWGSKVVERLNGIFAFAIWDKKTKELFCARDHMGVKPLYYFWDGKRFIFASEIKAILEQDIPRKLDIEALNRFMRVLYAPEPNTMIKGVYKLPKGHFLTLKGRSMKIQRYYEKRKTDGHIKYEEARNKVRNTVQSAVERQLVADVPVGVYLSGGIDSSVVLASVAKIKNNVKTFSIGFDLEVEEEREKFNRDFILAERTAKYFGAIHYPLTINADEVAKNLEEVIGSIDDPVSNPTSVPMAILSKFTKHEVTVVLSGNGGDELFGGYERYRMSRRVDVLGSIPGVKYILPKRIRGAYEMSALDRLAQFEFEKDKRLSRIFDSKFFTPMEEVKKYFSKYINMNLDKTEALMMADTLSWLPDQALSLGDKMSMLGSLEERVPLLDIEVVNLSQSLPLRYKVTTFKTKRILKDAFKDVLPKELLREPKRGWFSPGAKWMRREKIQKIFIEILSPSYYPPTKDLFNWEEVSVMLHDHINKKEYNLTVLWAILTFQIWAKKYSIQI
jgi:asparagine synthase (glutamine-hydrolysing)